MPNCPVCNAPLKKGAKFCALCGSKLETTVKTITCPNCGSAVKEGSEFCTVCGTKFEVKEEQKEAEKEEPKGMVSTGEADLSVLNSMEQMNNPKPSADGSSGEMDTTATVNLAEYEKEQEIEKEKEEEEQKSFPTMDAVEMPSINLDDLGTAEDEDKSGYPTMDSVEMPGQEKPKPKQEPQLKLEDIPFTEPEKVQPEVVKPEEIKLQNSQSTGNTVNTVTGGENKNALIPVLVILGVLVIALIVVLIKIFG